MTKPKSDQPTYTQLQAELAAVLAELQRDDLDVDDALRHYQRGLELIGQLEKYLKTAENQVRHLKAKFNSGSP